MRYLTISRLVIAAIWLVNGLYCKLLNGVPRHSEIVAVFVGDQWAQLFTVLIGLCEIALSLVILRNWRYHEVAVFQIVTILLMNVLEFIFAHELLLFGGVNIVFAILLCAFIFINTQFLQPKIRRVWDF